MGNLSLALITATLSFRIYKSVLAAVNKTNEGHPFKVRASDNKQAQQIGPSRLIFAIFIFLRIIPLWIFISNLTLYYLAHRQTVIEWWQKSIFRKVSTFYFEWRYKIFFRFQQFLDVDVTLPADKVSSLSNSFFAKLNNILLKLKSLLLVENTVESVKVDILLFSIINQN